MNEQQLRRLLQAAAEPAWDDEVRASSALYAGRQRHRRRLLGGALLTATTAAGLLALLPTAGRPATSVLLGCSRGTGTTGAGVVTAGPGGVTLAVDNPTAEVLTVRAGDASALAVPGPSAVTLPLASGRVTVQCGSGAPVALTVQTLVAAARCSREPASGFEVERGRVEQLTRARLGALPPGAVVTASAGASPLRQVLVRAGGAVVAEAVWHAMPGESDWHLESLSRCR